MVVEITAKHVAIWMYNGVLSEGQLTNEDAAASILSAFGQEFVSDTDAGGLSIKPSVHDVFRKFHSKSIRWDAADQTWYRE